MTFTLKDKDNFVRFAISLRDKSSKLQAQVKNRYWTGSIVGCRSLSSLNKPSTEIREEWPLSSTALGVERTKLRAPGMTSVVPFKMDGFSKWVVKQIRYPTRNSRSCWKNVFLETASREQETWELRKNRIEQPFHSICGKNCLFVKIFLLKHFFYKKILIFLISI